MKIPEGVTVEVAGGVVKVSGKRGSLERSFNSRVLKAGVDNGEFKAELLEKQNRKNNSLKHTLEAHVRNMTAGVQGEYEKRLKVVYAHFPISLEARGDSVLIKNFFGEKTPRKARVCKGAKVEIKGQDVTVRGFDKEAVGQTASNLVNATGPGKKDERVFQDGIYYE